MQKFWLAMALASMVASPTMGAMSATVAPNRVHNPMASRPGLESLNNGMHSDVPNGGSHIVIHKREAPVIVSTHRQDFRTQSDSITRLKKPFFYGFPNDGFYEGGVYGGEGYDGGGAGSTTNVIIYNNKQHEASKPERPAPGPHMVTLDQQFTNRSANRQDTVIEIRGTTVSTVKVPVRGG